MRAPLYSRYKKVKYAGITLERLLLIAIVAALTFFLIQTNSTDSNPLPEEISKSINFTVYVPPSDENAKYTLDKSKTSFQKESGVLSLIILTPKGNKVSTSQQIIPETFKDIPSYYPKLLTKLNEYAEFHTRYGTVTLTKPTELKGGQTAVSTAGGTLLFATPEKNMTEQEWKHFFDSLEVIR
jgi:hypothetical protein